MHKLTLALGVASLAIAGSAFAQPSAPPDAYHSAHHPQGPMTRAAAQERADKLFDKLDVNHDGKLDAADRTARREQRTDARFSRLDTDGNGEISRAEFAAAGDKMRARFAERAQAHDGKDGHGLAGRHVAWDSRHGAWGSHGPRHHGGLAMGGKMADTNHDGAISRHEFEATALAMFDRADANHDGTVTPEERRNMFAAHRDGPHREGPHRAGPPHDAPPPAAG